jgi:hypothetical protein
LIYLAKSDNDGLRQHENIRQRLIANEALYQLSYTPEIRVIYRTRVPIMEPNASQASEDAVQQFFLPALTFPERD